MRSEPVIYDLSKPAVKKQLIAEIRQLKGLHKVEVRKCEETITSAQQGYYFSEHVTKFAEFLQAQGENVTKYEAHMLMKAKFLRESVMDPRTGELIGETMPSIMDLSISEMHDYMEKCAYWLADMFNVIVKEPR